MAVRSTASTGADPWVRWLIFAILAVLVLVLTGIAYLLYTIEAPSVLLAGTKLALLTVPFVLYALWRYLYLIHVEGKGSAPDEVLLEDVPLMVTILLWGLVIVGVLYLS